MFIPFVWTKKLQQASQLTVWIFGYVLVKDVTIIGVF